MSSKKDSAVEVAKLPGGKNVRLSYSRGITVGMPNYGSERFDTSYACDVASSEAEDMAAKIKEHIDAEVRRAAQVIRKNPA